LKIISNLTIPLVYKELEAAMIDEKKVREALKSVLDPELNKNLIELGMIKNIRVEDGKVKLSLALTTLKCPRKGSMVGAIKQVLEKLPEVSSVDVQVTVLSAEERKRLFPKHPIMGIEKVSHTLAVASGKGGV
jgi:ATP-binding protein involved in chromosome partitioning